ncbi:rod-determining factor RdfA [Haloarchaeobius litoreus]|uniref:Rod-determining factor RdfA n=1 Tax=Haloarchaeobius litoreus TaxID=755306 RepID=A0ABD6DRW5_9EURY|nr:rod-determining factor RdfA [Haloarchaeobius litoreus]
MTNTACCKVGLLVDEYDLDSGETTDDIDDQLVSRWLGTGRQSSVGYRTLTEWFNKRLLRHAYERAGRTTISARIDGDYEALTADGIEKMEVVDELAADGIDAEAVLDDMISWSTMRNHLKDCLQASKEQQQADTDWERESIEIARERSTQKVKEALKSFKSKGRIEDEQDVEVDVRVQLCCSECPTRVPLDVALNRNYVCPDHKSIAPEDAERSIELAGNGGDSFHWSTSVHHRQEPSFGL